MEDSKFNFLLNELKEMRQEAKENGERLVQIETNLKQLTGNGKAGIIDEMRAQVADHEEFITTLKGGIKMGAWLGAASILGILKHIFFGHTR